MLEQAFLGQDRFRFALRKACTVQHPEVLLHFDVRMHDITSESLTSCVAQLDLVASTGLGSALEGL